MAHYGGTPSLFRACRERAQLSLRYSHLITKKFG
jgi:hypothetical protein